jgi:diguanylate cyclase (GGDEF)-like protein
MTRVGTVQSYVVVDIVKALRLLDEIEASKGNLYEWFAEALIGHDPVHTTFVRLWLDQTSRRNVAAYQTRIAARNASVFQGIRVDCGDLENLRQVVTDLRNAPPPSGSEQAVTVALAVETRSWELFDHELFAILATHFAPFVESLRKGCERHMALLGSLRRETDLREAEAKPAEKPAAEKPPFFNVTSAAPGQPETPEEVTGVWRPSEPTVTPSELLSRAAPDVLLRLLDSVPEAVYLVDSSRRVVHQNVAARWLAGKSAGTTTGERCNRGPVCPVTPLGLLDCADACALKWAMRLEVGLDGSLRIIGRSPQRNPASVHVHQLTDSSGASPGAILVVVDETAAASDRLGELERLAYLDVLTGLANRRYLEVTVISRLNELQRYGRGFGIIFIDVDGLKKVNDTYGHMAGDEVLRTVAATLAGNLRTSDLVGRWGGDEFLGVVANVDSEQLVNAADKLREMLAQSTCRAGEVELRSSVSIGATVACPEDTLETLLARSDRLMFTSKSGGRNRVCGDTDPPLGRRDTPG